MVAAGAKLRWRYLLADELINRIPTRMITGEIPVGSWVCKDRPAGD